MFKYRYEDINFNFSLVQNEVGLLAAGQHIPYSKPMLHILHFYPHRKTSTNTFITPTTFLLANPYIVSREITGH